MNWCVLIEYKFSKKGNFILKFYHRIKWKVVGMHRQNTSYDKSLCILVTSENLY